MATDIEKKIRFICVELHKKEIEIDLDVSPSTFVQTLADALGWSDDPMRRAGRQAGTRKSGDELEELAPPGGGGTMMSFGEAQDHDQRKMRQAGRQAAKKISTGKR